MRKKLILTAAVIAALSVASCNSKKTNGQENNNDSVGYMEAEELPLITANLKSIAGTYEGTLPAADCPGIKTELTIKADSTYQLSSDYIDRKDGHDEANGIIELMNHAVLKLIRPSSNDETFYKVLGNNQLIMTDSLGNEPEGETRKLYILTKKK